MKNGNRRYCYRYRENGEVRWRAWPYPSTPSFASYAENLQRVDKKRHVRSKKTPCSILYIFLIPLVPARIISEAIFYRQKLDEFFTKIYSKYVPQV